MLTNISLKLLFISSKLLRKRVLMSSVRSAISLSSSLLLFSMSSSCAVWYLYRSYTVRYSSMDSMLTFPSFVICFLSSSRSFSAASRFSSGFACSIAIDTVMS